MPGGEQWRRLMAAEIARQNAARRTLTHKRAVRRDVWRRAQPVVLRQPPEEEVRGDDET